MKRQRERQLNNISVIWKVDERPFSEQQLLEWVTNALSGFGHYTGHHTGHHTDQPIDPSTGVDILITDDEEITQLNRKYRRFDRPTNVLSFPSDLELPDGRRHLGDIAVSAETVAREAAAGDIPLLNHWAHLITHGLLHLLGMDHETDEDAAAMERLETEILSRLGIPNPYG